MTDRRSDADGNLATYLNEHLLASEGGVQAFKAAARTFEGTAHEQALLALSDEIATIKKNAENQARNEGERIVADAKEAAAQDKSKNEGAGCCTIVVFSKRGHGAHDG